MANIFTQIHATWPWFWPLLGGIFGAIIGSFVNCMRTRIAAGENLRYPPSKCDSCNARLKVVDLIPIFSYLALRGKCRHCDAVIGALTFWIEVILASFGAALLFCITQSL